MEDITFLEDYQYQLKLNELDRNLMEMERLSMEVANGLVAIHNATVVEQYQDKYGYTEHFQMLIGEEGLFDSAKEVLSSIISWLKKKLIQLASLIFNIVKGFVKFLTITISALDTVCGFASKYLQDLHKAYTKDGYSINMTFPMDQDFVRRLGEHYGMAFRIRNMVVTNTNPALWPNPLDDKPTAMMGWCMIGTGTNTVDFYVNVKVILSWFDRIFNAVTVGTSSKVDQFLFVVVHECRHLYDSQMGTTIDMTKDYDEQEHEHVANDAARTFKISDSDRAWAKKIIQAVEAEYKRQKNK